MAATLALLRLSPEEAAARISTSAAEDWTLRFVDELDRRIRIGALERIMSVWDLPAAGMARLFAVSRQAVAKWLEGGPPADRAEAIADLAAATELLERYVRRDRIPAVVRRRADALGGQSLLEIAGAGEHRRVLDAVRAMFDLRRVQP